MALVEWKHGKRDSVDGRWFINAGSTRVGDRSVREFHLVDQRYGRPGVGRGVFNRAVEARERAEEIVAEEQMPQVEQMTPPLYHGTRAAYSGHGGLVLPGDHVDRENHGLGRSDWVYLTDDLDLAWHYAEACAGTGRPRVLVVRPCGLVEVDDSTIGGEEQSAYRCEWARVERVIFREAS